jgi:O-antigen/teichoic acid export membrane protein
VIYYPIENIWLFFIILNLFSVTVFFSGIFRANQKYTIAQLATNGWKIVLVIIFFLIAQKQMLNFLGISLAIVCFTLILLYIKLYGSAKKDTEVLKYEDYRKTGVAFFLHNMTLTSAVYGEQFIINLYGNDYISSQLFMYFAIFSPIILSANGFIGFIIGPKLRAKKTVTRKDYNSLQFKLIIFALVMASISFGVGIFLLDRFKDVPFSEIDLGLTFAVLITCMIRTVYTTSSLYLGVFASNKHLYKTAGLNWTALIAYIILILVVLIAGWDTSILIVGIAALTALHWTTRLIISHTYAIKFFDNEKH